MRGFLVIMLLLLGWRGMAQTLNDAVLFSQNLTQGNARFHAMAGSMGALGGNSSANLINPAGNGVHRKGEFSASIINATQGYASSYLGFNNTDVYNRTRLSNFNLTFSNKLYDIDWKYFNLSLTYNRKNNFDASYSIEGDNSLWSKLDRYVLDIREEDIYVEDIYATFPFGAGLAWDVTLIDTINGDYYHALENYGHRQKVVGKTTGGTADYSIGFGANYQNKLFVGGALGISVLNYRLEETYSETPFSTNNLTALTKWKESTQLDITGRGWNIKLGMLYWFREKFRMGLAFNSGTSLTISEQYIKEIEADWKLRENTYSKSPNGFNEYKVVSPHNIILSAAVVDKYIGSLNLDAELVTYGRVRYKSVTGFPVDFTKVNQQMTDELIPALNLRLGGELLFGSWIARAGGALYGNPVRSQSFFNRYAISGGVGYRIKRITADVGYSYTHGQNLSKDLYFSEGLKTPKAEMNFNSHQVVLTLGFKFLQLE